MSQATHLELPNATLSWMFQNILVVITRRPHLFPYRTQQLSFSVPTILGWQRPGKIGLRQIYIKASCDNARGFELLRRLIFINVAENVGTEKLYYRVIPENPEASETSEARRVNFSEAKLIPISELR